MVPKPWLNVWGWEVLILVAPPRLRTFSLWGYWCRRNIAAAISCVLLINHAKCEEQDGTGHGNSERSPVWAGTHRPLWASVWKHPCKSPTNTTHLPPLQWSSPTTYLPKLQSRPVLQASRMQACIRAILASWHCMDATARFRQTNTLAPSRMENHKDWWTSMKIWENQWKSKKMNEDQLKSMGIGANHKKSWKQWMWKSIKINENQLKAKKDNGNQWKSFRLDEDQWNIWTTMEINKDQWRNGIHWTSLDTSEKVWKSTKI